MLTIRRLDFTNTLTAMLTVACRHAARLEGASQRALDDITEHLHTIDRLIATHRLADALNGPIPPAPLPHQVGEEDDDDDDAISLDDEPEGLDSAPQRPRSPRNIFPDLTTGPKLSPSQTAVLDHIRANPGCTGAEIVAATGYSLNSVNTMISAIRKTTPIRKSKLTSHGVSSYSIGV